jgi:peptide/nickel transport system substrate-binding protein
MLYSINMNDWDSDMARLLSVNSNTNKAVLNNERVTELLSLGCSTTDEAKRAEYYKEALDIVMQLAVELPTYQRSDLYAYNTNIIDVNSLTPESELTPYNGPMIRIWEVSLNETK